MRLERVVIDDQQKSFFVKTAAGLALVLVVSPSCECFMFSPLRTSVKKLEQGVGECHSVQDPPPYSRDGQEILAFSPVCKFNTVVLLCVTICFVSPMYFYFPSLVVSSVLASILLAVLFQFNWLIWQHNAMGCALMWFGYDVHSVRH